MDIAGNYYAKPWSWPDIWELNPQVEDPHWIYPGDVLQISTVKVVYHTPEGKQIDPTQQQVKLPPIYIEEMPGFDSLFVYKTQANRIDFISDEKLKGSGEIIENIDDRKILGTYDSVWFDYDQDQNIQIGDRLAVFTIDDKIKGGYLVNFRGELETVDAVYKDNRDRYVYYGAIRNTLEEIEPGHMLMKYDDRPLQISLSMTDKDISGEIFYFDTNLTVEAEYNTVFIDVGSEQGVEIGNSFSIYREANNKRKVPDYYIGNLIVIKVGNEHSTAMITNSLIQIELGDKIVSDQL